MLKQGQKLKDKDDVEECHIGGVCGEVYFVVRDLGDIAIGTYTESEILEQYDLVEEKWEPEEGERYWFFGDNGRVVYSYWDGDPGDIFRRDYLGIYQTQEEAQTARGNMKKIN